MNEERFFASDNAAPVHPEAMHALDMANRGHAMAYGGDALTKASRRRISGVTWLLPKSPNAFPVTIELSTVSHVLLYPRRFTPYAPL